MIDEAKDIKLEYIRRIYGEACGPHRTPLLYYRNTHPSWRIRIFVDHHYVYNNEEIHERQAYVLEPNPNAPSDEVTEKDKLMGCPIPGPTMQRFHWDLVGAEKA